MARLPQPGGDTGEWGQILNDYLLVSHNQDGTIKSEFLQSEPAAPPANATGTTNGVIRLAGDLAGTADAPTVPGLAAKANTSHSHTAGDITSGTISASRLPVATTTDTGVVQIATNDEVVTGTDTAKAVTPAGVAAAIDAIELPSSPIVFVDSVDDIPVGTPANTLVVVRAA